MLTLNSLQKTWCKEYLANYNDSDSYFAFTLAAFLFYCNSLSCVQVNRNYITAMKSGIILTDNECEIAENITAYIYGMISVSLFILWGMSSGKWLFIWVV